MVYQLYQPNDALAPGQLGVGHDAPVSSHGAEAISANREQSADIARTTIEVVTPSTSEPTSVGRKPAPARFRLDGQKMSVTVLTDLAALETYLPALEELAASAMEPNVYYEPWYLHPSLKAFGKGQDFFFALVFAPAVGDPKAPQTLCGFFPLVRERSYKGLPISVLRLWQHRYCPLCTPLVRPEHADECLTAFFRWLADSDHPSAANCSVVELRYIAGDGPFHNLLVDYLYNFARPIHTEDHHVRAVFRPAESAEVYLNEALSGRRRKDLRLQSKHLAEVGRIEYTELTGQDDVDHWMNDFLQLEASGWKGKEGSAIASQKEDQEFFREIAREGFRRGQIRMLSLNLNGRPIAQTLDFTAGRAAFALKMAYDEGFSRYSPSVLLELENLRRLHECRQLDWVDSCAVPEHFMMNRLFTSRRVIQTVLIATGRKPGAFFVSVLPLLRWLKRLLRRPARQTQNME